MKKQKRVKGASIAEAGAALTLLLPLAFLVIFVIVEVSYAYMIHNSLSQAARQAARDLAIAYAENPAIASSRSLQDSMVFENIRIHNILASNNQFDNPVFETASEPPTVSATVRYTGGQYGLPPFPNPDVLHLGNSLVIRAISTYRLE